MSGSIGALPVEAGVLGPLPADMLAQCYGEMRLLARRIMADNVLARVLQPTELANEAAIRLIRSKLSNLQDKGHTLALAARIMRQVMIDEVRKTASAKRNAPLMMTFWPGGDRAALVDLGDLDEALTALTAFSPERAQIVELRFMFGMTVEETAVAVGSSERTVKRHWQAARAWLLDYINGDPDARLD